MSKTRLLCLGSLALAGLLGPFLALPAAQRNQPIYPTYDGFLRNPDGTYTLSFGYFSHNAEIVTVPPGANNTFEQTPGDRQQPTTFHPGHHRFQCVMVVDKEFDGKMRWMLTFAGTATGTSQNMLQSNWNLVEGAAEMRTIDFAKVKRGVCLNRAPDVTVLGLTGRGRGVAGTMTAAVGETLNIFGSVEDEGLPRTPPMVVGWKQISGPGKTTFSNPDAARTRATFSAVGEYQLELTANDSEFTRSVRISVTVR